MLRQCHPSAIAAVPFSEEPCLGPPSKLMCNTLLRVATESITEGSGVLQSTYRICCSFKGSKRGYLVGRYINNLNIHAQVEDLCRDMSTMITTNKLMRNAELHIGTKHTGIQRSYYDRRFDKPLLKPSTRPAYEKQSSAWEG